MNPSEASSCDPKTVPPWTLYSERQRWCFLAVLFLVSTSNYADRFVISVLLEPIKQEFHVSDKMLGLLGGFCFALFYSLFGLPIARWADRGNRRTIITLALTVWSVMTVFCGLAQSFAQLALARVGVGVGESGAIPPAHSLIADYFPAKRRAGAIGIFTTASVAGGLLGLVLGGNLAAKFGWRVTLFVGGTPGLALALATYFGLAEPRMQLGFPSQLADYESIRETLEILRAKRGFLYALVGCILYFVTANGVLIFMPSFLNRVLHVPLAKVSVSYGTVSTVAGLIGTLGGGWLSDYLGRRDVRWLAWLPAVACALAAPIYMVAFSLHALWSVMALTFVAGMLMNGGLTPFLAAIHAVCGNRRRATAIAIVLFFGTVFGGGFGPLVIGAISDSLNARYGVDGLRYALMLVMSFSGAAGLFFYFFGRAMPTDLED